LDLSLASQDFLTFLQLISFSVVIESESYSNIKNIQAARSHVRCRYVHLQRSSAS